MRLSEIQGGLENALLSLEESLEAKSVLAFEKEKLEAEMVPFFDNKRQQRPS